MRSSYRLSVLIAALGLSVASAGSKQTSQNQGPNPGPQGGEAPAQGTQTQMDAKDAMGLWKSNFGAVKIEADPGVPGTVRGVWLYERNGQEVVGYFAGGLSGNMLQFSWEEPASGGAPMAGGGYLMFDPQGQSFQGKWWTSNRDRGGNWSGWRGQGGAIRTEPIPNDPVAPAPAPHEPGSDFI